MSYKASVSNIFELLGEEGEEGKRQTPQVNVGGSDDKNAPKKPAAAPAKTQAKPKTDAPKADRPAQGNKGQDRRPRDAAPRSPAPAGGEGEEVVQNRQPRQRRDGERGGRGGYVPRGGSKRVFDRRSGTGRGPRENKKGGAGGHNWGTVEDDAVAQSENVKPEEKAEGQEGAQAAEAQPAAAAGEQVATEQPKEEEEDKTQTFEEFLKNKKSVNIELPKPRQANEGASNDQWKGFVALKKKDEEEGASKKEEKKPAEKKKEVVPVNEVFKIQEEKKRGGERSDRGGRGGRGGKRGGATGGQKRGSSGPAPNVLDESSFPALATKA